MMPRWNIIAFVALTLAGLVGVVGCEKFPGEPTQEDIVLNPTKITDFAILYGQNCAGCHGQDGSGNGALALANPIYLAIANDEVLQSATAQGVPGTLMPAFALSSGGFLTDAQVTILVKGMRSRWARPDALGGTVAPPYAAAVAGNPTRGAAVFATSCASCHGAAGKGGDKIASIVDGSFLALVSDQNLRTTVIAGRPDLGHPDWRSVPGQPLTSEQVSDVVSWLVSQRPADPGRPYSP
jgi:cytochrome c oxidase cbb3-type subunit III